MRVNGFSWEAGGALGETLIGQRGEAPGGVAARNAAERGRARTEQHPGHYAVRVRGLTFRGRRFGGGTSVGAGPGRQERGKDRDAGLRRSAGQAWREALFWMGRCVTHRRAPRRGGGGLPWRERRVCPEKAGEGDTP